MVYVLCHAPESFLLGFRGDSGRHFRVLDSLQYGRARFCHDGDVCRDIHGTVDEGEEPCERVCRNRDFFVVSACFWCGELYDSGDDRDSGSVDAS